MLVPPILNVLGKQASCLLLTLVQDVNLGVRCWTILKNRQDACSTNTKCSCGTGILPVADIGTRCEFGRCWIQVWIQDFPIARSPRVSFVSSEKSLFIPWISNAWICSHSAIEIVTIQTVVHSQPTSEIKGRSKLYYVNLCKSSVCSYLSYLFCPGW